MRIFLSSDMDACPPGGAKTRLIKRALGAAADLEKLKKRVQVSVTLVDDAKMRSINREFRGADKVTDVISFALNEGEETCAAGGPEKDLLGEIVICLPQAARQAEEYGHSLERELSYLAAHGFLHLLGYDHITAQDRKAMRAQEENIMAKIGLVRP
ncbi:MAG: rRNA maturation RNase YbeY [Acidaminococcales bacterium]|jgi:probable rRNA maturation factor|nr:rRNA maturation RNase YbeY [Acidaminococcales bacterium]